MIMIMKYDIYSLGIMVAVISFLGFSLENLWLSLTKGFIDNRNMNAPFLMGYGLLVVGMYLLLGTPENMALAEMVPVDRSKGEKFFVYFLCAFAVVTVGELILGHLMEKICGIQYWNYNWIPLHITQYTSIPTSIGFAAIITSFMGACFDPIMSVITIIPAQEAKSASIILMLIMSTDLVASFSKMHRTRSLNTKWQIQTRRSHLKTT